MKGAIALAVLGTALLAVAGSQPWWAISQAPSSTGFSSQPARSFEFSLNDYCANESSGYYGYFGCSDYSNGGPYGVRGVSQGANAAASLAFALALAEAVLIGAAALWPRTSALSRWAGLLSVAFAALALVLFTALIPGKAANGFPDEWKMNLFFGSYTGSGDHASWGPGLGWYLAVAAIVVLAVAFFAGGRARQYLAPFPPVPLSEVLGTGRAGTGPQSLGPATRTWAGPPNMAPPGAPLCLNCRAPLAGPVCGVCGTVNS